MQSLARAVDVAAAAGAIGVTDAVTVRWAGSCAISFEDNTPSTPGRAPGGGASRAVGVRIGCQIAELPPRSHAALRTAIGSGDSMDMAATVVVTPDLTE